MMKKLHNTRKTCAGPNPHWGAVPERRPVLSNGMYKRVNVDDDDEYINREKNMAPLIRLRTPNVKIAEAIKFHEHFYLIKSISVIWDGMGSLHNEGSESKYNV